MGLLRRREVSSAIEEKILTGMIVSDSFCRDISRIIGKDTFAVPFIARVATWCKDYYKKYKQAPGSHISDIFDIEKEHLEDADRNAISNMLASLAESHDAAEFNEEYLKDRALEYFKSRQIKLATEKATKLIELGRVEEAEMVFAQHKRTSLATSNWEDPFDTDTIKNFFADEVSGKNTIFQLPGDIGKFIGPFPRNTLIGFLAPTKRGKTFWLLEMALQAAFSRKKVVFVSLEMNSQRVKKRLYKRLTSMAPETKDYRFPCFDCRNNQDNSCSKQTRTNNIRLLDSEGKKPEYSPEMTYKVCTACRGEKGFVPATWFTTIRKERMKPAQATKLIRSEATHFGANLKIISYPSFSANIDQVRADIKMLEEAEGFIPDVIVIDYADILAPEDARETGRDRIDRTWKTLKRMADEIHCCVVSASQSNRGSFEKKNVVQTDASEDIRKISNSDLFLAINQTPQEKKEGVTRISRIAARDEDFDQFESVIVLQNLAFGQVMLDSCSMRNNFVDLSEDFLI